MRQPARRASPRPHRAPWPSAVRRGASQAAARTLEAASPIRHGRPPEPHSQCSIRSARPPHCTAAHRMAWRRWARGRLRPQWACQYRRVHGQHRTRGEHSSCAQGTGRMSAQDTRRGRRAEPLRHHACRGALPSQGVVPASGRAAGWVIGWVRCQLAWATARCGTRHSYSVKDARDSADPKPASAWRPRAGARGGVRAAART